MVNIALLKSHIEAFTRKNGVLVMAHDDKRSKKAIPPAIDKLVNALTPVTKDGWKHSFRPGLGDTSTYPVRTGGGNHANSLDEMGDQGWRMHKKGPNNRDSFGGPGGFLGNADHDIMLHPDGHVAHFRDGNLTIHHADREFPGEQKHIKKLWEKAGE